ncbi:MAG: DinB family protein [candidate division Zixibacteria bacterium]|nr:DinB family protein [candidate division Zixibacteria bacterium]
MNSQDLKYQFSLCHSVLKRATDGLTNGKEFVSPKEGGNCASWILGHLVHYRNKRFYLLEIDPLYPAEKYVRYKKGTSPLSESDSGLPFAELITAFDKIHEAWMTALDEMTEDKLSAKTPDSTQSNPDETVGSLLSKMVFQEAYHIGQIGLLRKVCGLPGAVG